MPDTATSGLEASPALLAFPQQILWPSTIMPVGAMKTLPSRSREKRTARKDKEIEQRCSRQGAKTLSGAHPARGCAAVRL
jgi:hypothetical protein